MLELCVKNYSNMAQTRKILVPNDFSVRPLILLKKIMETSEGTNFEITLLHGIYPPSSITDLLFYNKMNLLEEMETEEYLQACDLFKSKFESRIVAMNSDIIASPRRHALNDFLEVSGIEEVYVPAGMKMDFRSKQSFDIVSLLKKASVPVRLISFEPAEELSAEAAGDLAGLFLSGLSKSFVKMYEGSTAVS